MASYGAGPMFDEPEPIEFMADRPFLFYIREIRRNQTVFSGKFVTSAH